MSTALVARRTCLGIWFVLMAAVPSLAQRTLDWDAVDVSARLDAHGRLYVDETQTIVFNGDWNGGERTFNIRPRQQFTFTGIYRDYGGRWLPLVSDDSLDGVDEYTWVDGETLRWRSRLPTDAPFAGSAIRYLLRYELSNILLRDGDRYVLDHDFLFPERDGVIRRFDLRLTLDPAWQAPADFRESYAAQNVQSGDGFVLTLPLGHTGAVVPAALDTSRPPEVRLAVLAILGVTGFAILWMFVGESARGRFAPLPNATDEAWLQEHVFKYPAEVVGAAWDERIASPEVIALIARMVSEGKLESTVQGKGKSLALHLKVDRETLTGHERTLVDRLFFNNRTTTNTELVKKHYRKSGFDPALEIGEELRAVAAVTVPKGERRRLFRYATRVLVTVGLFLLAADWSEGRLGTTPLVMMTIGALLLVALALNVGAKFRQHIEWGRRAALYSVLPAVIAALGAAAILWWYIGLGVITASRLVTAGITLVTLGIVSACINAMVARQHAAGVAFRKRLAAARAFFIGELEQREPALRDEWFPWLLALGLGEQMDDWSVRQKGKSSSRSSGWSSSSSSPTTSTPSWTGFAGGRSGGAGGGAAWTTAASGLAAGVSPPSSSSSGSGGSSSSSSSSGGSSGGGGGGGW